MSPLILANMGPPSHYRVEIPPELDSWHEWAAPIFLTLAIVFAGVWVLRFGSIRSSASRAVLLAWVCFAGTSYTAWWIWEHRIQNTALRTLESFVAVEMPFLLFTFAMVFSVIVQLVLVNRNDLPSDPALTFKLWRVRLLAALTGIFGGLGLLFMFAANSGPHLIALALLLALTLWVLAVSLAWIGRKWSAR